MCDTIVALGHVTADGKTLFAKNTDRDPNEGHALVYIPRTQHAAGETVSFRSGLVLPQVRETNAVFLSQPFWMWGCEIGLNEHGVAIGSEKVSTKEPYQEGGGLLGRDMMRLALERAATAREALDVITGLLAMCGQGRQAGWRRRIFYYTTFLIADPGEAWVLETSGCYWAALRVRDFYAISNRLTIGTEWDLAAPGLVEHALKRGWCRSRADFHFARCYSTQLYTRLACGGIRRARAMELLGSRAGRITPATLMALLRDHGPGEKPDWRPAQGTPKYICMHAGWGITRAHQTANSLVAQLEPGLLACWVTGTAAPCTGIFKPVWPGMGLPPDLEPKPGATYDPATLWWRHERLHRAVLEDYARLSLYASERDAMEAEFLDQATRLVAAYRSAPVEVCQTALAEFSAMCFARANEAVTRWTEHVLAEPVRRSPPPWYRLAWRRWNHLSSHHQ